MTDMTTTLDTLELEFKTLQSTLTTLGKETKTMQDSLKNLQKIFKQSEKLNKMKKKRPQVKLSLSKELENFLSVDKGTKLTKAEVMKNVSNYIKEQNLQIQEDKRRFQPNKDLSKLFGIKNTKNNNMTFVEINKHVSQHLTR